MPLSLEEIARAVGARCAGDGKTQIAGFASFASAAATDVVFAEDGDSLESALSSPAGAVITAESAATTNVKKPLLITSQPRLAFARVARLLHTPRRQSAGVHSTAVVHRSAKIGNLVHIAHNVIIGDNVVIAALTGISGSSVIEKGAVCGGQVGIGDHVRVEEGAILGAQCGVPSKKVIRGKGVVFWGTPARPLQQYLKELAVLARMAKKS